MRKLKAFITLVILLTTTPALVYPWTRSEVREFKQQRAESRGISYDTQLCYLYDIESGVAERRGDSPLTAKSNVIFLARKGVLPDNSLETLSLEQDIKDLETENHFAIWEWSPDDYSFMIASAAYGYNETLLCKTWMTKQWKQIKKFVKKHKKAILIGAAVVTATTAIILAAAASRNEKRQRLQQERHAKKEGEVLSLESLPIAETVADLKANLDDQVVSFKETLVENQFFPPENITISGESLSLEEKSRTLGALFAQESLHTLQKQTPYQSIAIPESYSSIDRDFSTNYAYLYATQSQEPYFEALAFQAIGEKALDFGYYHEAADQFGKAIQANPANPFPYLERGIAYFELGQYDQSLKDYKQFAAQNQQTHPLSVTQFAIGFARGLPRGVYESGEHTFLFISDFVQHPIHTSKQLVDTVTTLTKLVQNDEWGVIAEALAPEVQKLVKQWEFLPSDQRGELAGYTVGKLGTDILIPGAMIKVAGKSAKAAQELSSICKNFKIAQETLLLETAATMGDTAKVAEVVRNGQTMMALGEEVGLTTREMAQLKQTGKLENAINGSLEEVISQSESEIFKISVSRNKHVKMVRDYLDKPAKEVQKGVNSYEKQIAVHKDKIMNPTKYYPDWNKLDVRQREALINKKWPAEIQGYEEQKNILQSILNERVKHEL